MVGTLCLVVLGSIKAGGEGSGPSADAWAWRARPRVHELRHPPWQLGAEAERLVGSDFTDTRYGWRIPSAYAGPIDGEPLESDEAERVAAAAASPWDQEDDRKPWEKEMSQTEVLYRVMESLPQSVRAGLTPPGHGWNLDGGNVSDIDEDVAMFTPRELQLFRAPGRGPIGRVPREKLEEYRRDLVRRRLEACPFGPDELSENYPWLPPTFRFRFSSPKDPRMRAVFPFVDARLLQKRAQPEFDLLRAPRMMEEHESHLVSQQNKILRSLIDLGSLSGHNVRNSRGDVVLEAETIHGQVPDWDRRADLDEKLRVMDYRIQEGLKHSVLDPARYTKNDTTPSHCQHGERPENDNNDQNNYVIMEQLELGLEGSDVSSMADSISRWLAAANISQKDFVSTIDSLYPPDRDKDGREEKGGASDGGDVAGGTDVGGAGGSAGGAEGGKFSSAHLWLRGVYPGDPFEGPYPCRGWCCTCKGVSCGAEGGVGGGWEWVGGGAGEGRGDGSGEGGPGHGQSWTLDRHGHLLLLPRAIGSVGGGDGVILDLELASPEQRQKIMRLARR